VLLVAPLIVAGTLVALWLPASAGSEREIVAAYTQYLPFVPVVNCVPGNPILPDDLERDIAVEARINEIREEHGLPRLANSQKITQAALRHSNDMADNNFFSHTGSDGSRAGDRLDEACYNWQEYGEIIAAGFRSPSSVVAAWMDSPGHRGIILDDTLADFGAGYAYNGSSDLKHYWTVDFGLLTNERTSASDERHTCIYHLQDGASEMWVSLYTSQPCELNGGEPQEKIFQE